MSERRLELRLQAVARGLDEQAPAFDVALLRSAPRRRVRGRVVALVCAVAVAVAGVAAVPAAVSALQHLFDVDEVPELGPLAPDVAPPFEGRLVPVGEAQASVPFRVRTISSLGAPDEARVRDDITGGMVTVGYDGRRILLTQWPAAGVHARIAVVPVSGTAEEVVVGRLRALWVAGTARGTFTLVGADGAVHRELFDVAEGALIWQEDGVDFLLQGAGSKENATRLAAEVGGRS